MTTHAHRAHDRHEPEGDGMAERDMDLCIKDDNCGSSAHLPNCPEDADSTPTEREARVRFPKSVGNATVDMETIQPTEREAGDVGEVAAEDLGRLREVVETAYAEVVRLCQRDERWRMSIPADPRRDSDLLIGDALAALPSLLDRLEAAEAKVARVEAILKRLADDDLRYDTSYGAAGLMRLEEDLRAALDGEA